MSRRYIALLALTAVVLLGTNIGAVSASTTATSSLTVKASTADTAKASTGATVLGNLWLVPQAVSGKPHQAKFKVWFTAIPGANVAYPSLKQDVIPAVTIKIANWPKGATLVDPKFAIDRATHAKAQIAQLKWKMVNGHPELVFYNLDTNEKPVLAFTAKMPGPAVNYTLWVVAVPQLKNAPIQKSMKVVGLKIAVPRT